MLSTWVTMGEKVKIFEEKFCEYIGSENAIMVNSGSSANLLALSILTNPLFDNKIEKGSSIITPAVTWATTVSPIVNVGCKPLFVDVDLDTLCINTDLLEESVSEETSVIMPVHLMGYPCDMKKISKIASENDLHLIEDSCEAIGSSIEGKKVGTFGDIGTFSFFISHHITTIEGGMLTTNNKGLNELGRSMRTFGWSRELGSKKQLEKNINNNIILTGFVPDDLLPNYYQKAQENYKTPTELLKIKHGISMLFYKLGVHELAIENLLEMLKIIDENEKLDVAKKDYQIIIYQMLSLSYIKMKDYENALKYAHKNVILSKNYYDTHFEINSYLIYAGVAAQLDKNKEAEKYIENLEQESHHLKIDNAQLTEQIYNEYKKKVKEAK